MVVEGLGLHGLLHGTPVSGTNTISSRLFPTTNNQHLLFSTYYGHIPVFSRIQHSSQPTAK